MVRVRVGHESYSQPLRAMPYQEGNHNPAPSVHAIVGWTGVDHDPAARRSSQDRSISLTNVEKM
jgi:hypothetical protein